jgi:mono/diheme cytochrome c family protein
MRFQMQLHRGGRMTLGIVSLLAAACAVTLTGAQGARDPVVTPASGPSWLNQLGLPFTDTSPGRGAGAYAPPPAAAVAPAAPAPLLMDQRMVSTGQDLYRYSCQVCHGARGSGAPSEIASMLPLVALGHAGRGDLYKRIHTGGLRMPARDHLTGPDVDLLYGYLNQLAGARASVLPKERVVSWPRLGELVVKGTCQICHDAVGPRPSGRARLDGAIPPLNVVMADKPVMDFVDKVRRGAPVVMGDLHFHYRGRMPVFTYLRDQEVAAAYLYLSTFPPRASAETPRPKR